MSKRSIRKRRHLAGYGRTTGRYTIEWSAPCLDPYRACRRLECSLCRAKIAAAIVATKEAP